MAKIILSDGTIWSFGCNNGKVVSIKEDAPVKICARKECNKTFKPYRHKNGYLQRYHSPQCSNIDKHKDKN